MISFLHASRGTVPRVELRPRAGLLTCDPACLPAFRNRCECLAAAALLLTCEFASATADIGSPAPSSTFADDPVSLAIMPFITWAALVLGVIGGSLAFSFTRRHLWRRSWYLGAGTAIAVALVAQMLLSSLWLNPAQKECRSAEFGETNTSDLAINCGSARERGANAFGTVSLYIDATERGAGNNRPVPVQVLNLVETGSLLVLTLAFYALASFGVRRTIAV